MNHLELRFHPISSEQSAILIAELNEIGFEGFEEVEETLLAFVGEGLFDANRVEEIVNRYNLSYTLNTIEETNWNNVWESNFSPVIVDDFVAIRADFHDPISTVGMEIVITPKMSFGTGHHATTYMMIQQMRNMDFAQKSVFDFGTGTGILAILAEHLGADRVLAIDYDEWSITNASENLEKNSCSIVELRKQDTAATNAETFDIILANINKHIILENFKLLVSQLNQGGKLLLSGLLSEDRDDIMKLANAYELEMVADSLRHNWLILSFSRN